MNRITVVPLGENLLRRVAEEIVEKYYSAADPLSLAGVTVVVPHRRGIVYLRHYLLQLVGTLRPGPMISPRLMTIEDFTSQIAVAADASPGRALDATDQAWLLFRLAKDLGLYKDVAGSWDRFFGWGVRLAGILDEIDREMIDPRDIIYPEDVPAEAQALLGRLKEIYEKFTATLEARGFTTRAKRVRRAAEVAVAMDTGETGAGSAGDLAGLPAGPTYLVGFYATSRAEDHIFRYLFDRGARIFWHADPSALPQLYRRWQEAWKVEIDAPAAAAPPGGQPAREGPTIHQPPRFHETYDLHSEVRAVRDILLENTASGQAGLPDACALVLPDPSALVPTLYHIPETIPVNISIGYPLERSSLAALFEQVMLLEEGKPKDGSYYYRDYLTLIRHPYVRRLPTPAGKDGGIVLHILEDRIRQYGRPFIGPADARDLLAAAFAEEKDRGLLAGEGIDLDEAVAHVDELGTNLLKPWQAVKTPEDAAAALRQTVRFLFAAFVGRPHFVAEQLLDIEFVHALEQQVIPGLEDALFARQPMAQGLLFALLRDLIHMARVPFEGQPLKGLQILGLLETRLLSFDRVIVIDANEGLLPGHEEVNPLLPEPLRPAIGLPPKEKEEAITRYHFERLVGSAREVHLVWQSSTTPSTSGLEGKKTRSRYVEALLWDEEVKAGSLLGDVIKRQVLAIPARALVRAEGLERLGTEAAKIADFLKAHAASYGISATLLNRYVRCPARFLYEYLLGLEVPHSPLEDIDSAELGTLVHQALEAYFKPFEGREYVRDRDSDAAGLVGRFTQIYRDSQMYRSLAAEKRFFLESVVKHRLEGYVDAAPEVTAIESLERRYSTVLPTSLGELAFGGKVDRIDRREGKRIILDYKTGAVDTFGATHFASTLQAWPLPERLDYEGLKALREVLPDLQLPLYVVLVGRAGAEGKAKDAPLLSAYVELRSPSDADSKERYFVKPARADALGDDYAAWFSEVFPGIVAYVIDHMVGSPCFYRATGPDDCTYCDYSAICPLASA